MSLLEITQGAIADAVGLIESLGVTCYYRQKDATTPVKIKALVRQLGVAELVSDYRQGDLRVGILSDSLSFEPKKYDVLEIGDNKYAIKDNPSSKRVGDTDYMYKFVVRGQ